VGKIKVGSYKLYNNYLAQNNIVPIVALKNIYFEIKFDCVV